MDEAIATSQIEGAVTTRRVATDLLRTGRLPADRSQQMIVNGYNTIGLVSANRNEAMSIDLLYTLQKSITLDTLDHPDKAGRFRNECDGEAEVVDVRTNDAISTPPPASLVPERMKLFIAFANLPPGSETFIHPAVHASILHFWLAYEHPFCDGNGRTARAIFYWYMLRNGYRCLEFLTISRIINMGPMAYYRAFRCTETDGNDLTYFIAYLLRMTVRAIDDLRDRIDEQDQEQLQLREVVATRGLNARQRLFLAEGARNPTRLHTFKSHQRAQRVTLVTARADLLKLVGRGFFVEVGGRRPREFAPAPGLKKMLLQK